VSSNRIALAFAAVLFAALGTSISAAPPVPGWDWETPEDRPFPILGWWGPPSHLLNDTVWGDMAAAGFNLCMPPFPYDEPNRKALALGEKHGIGIVAIGVEWEFAKKPEKAAKLEANIQDKVAQWAKEPAFAAYRLKDEPGIVSYPHLATTRDRLEELDPGHWSYVNLFPSYAPVNEKENYLGSRNYQEYVDQYMEIFRPEVLSFDHYCIEGYHYRKHDYAIRIRPEYFENLEIIRAAALKHGVPFWAFTLISPVFSYPTPTEGHVRFQLFSNLAYGAKGLQYFTYGPAEGKKGIIDNSGNRMPQYELAKRINWEIQNLGPLLLDLTSTAVFHTSPQPQGTTWIYEGYGGLLTCEGAPALFGFFDGPDERKFLMVVNRDPFKAADIALTFDDSVTAVSEIDRSQPGGHALPLERMDGELKFTLPDGDGKLLELKREE
jgi:hypothetical protein